MIQCPISINILISIHPLKSCGLKNRSSRGFFKMFSPVATDPGFRPAKILLPLLAPGRPKSTPAGHGKPGVSRVSKGLS